MAKITQPTNLMVLSFGLLPIKGLSRENLSLGKYPSFSIADARKLQRNFENHIFPKLSHKPIDQINAAETISVLKPLAAKGSL